MIRVRELYEQPSPEHPYWISGGVLPRSGIALVGGEAKVGKTFLALDLAHNLATGGSLWGTEFKMVEPVPVYYFEQEVGEREFQRRVKKRYDALGMKPPENFFAGSRLKDFFLDTATGQKILAQEIQQSGAKVAIIDPIGRCLAGDENSNTEVGRLFGRLDELLSSVPDLSIVIMHHFGKPPKEDDGLPELSPYRFRGASKWFDAPDSLITVIRMADHPGEWKRLKMDMVLRQGEPLERPIKLSILPGGIVKPTKEEIKGALQPAGPQAWAHH